MVVFDAPSSGSGAYGSYDTSSALMAGMGSGSQQCDFDNSYSEDNEGFDSCSEGADSFDQSYATYGSGDKKGIIHSSLPFDVNNPPTYNGRFSFYVYEQQVLDWVDVTKVEVARRGPLLKSRLLEEAHFLQKKLEPEKLRLEEGVQYLSLIHI